MEKIVRQDCCYNNAEQSGSKWNGIEEGGVGFEQERQTLTDCVPEGERENENDF